MHLIESEVYEIVFHFIRYPIRFCSLDRRFDTHTITSYAVYFIIDWKWKYLITKEIIWY